jgi:CRP-like cAMP-binding protein
LVKPRSTRNAILLGLHPEDFELLRPHLVRVVLPLRKTLEYRKKRIETVYFPENGFASVVANYQDKKPIEIGVIGREGMTGTSLVLGADRSSHETYMQYPGDGQQISAQVLVEAIKDHPSLQRSLLSAVRNLYEQVTSSVLANGRGSIEERLARWLLLAADRTDDVEMTLTHEFLAMMLGVTRPGVTISLLALERRGFITRRRKAIVILDRHALETMTKSMYSNPNQRQ